MNTVAHNRIVGNEVQGASGVLDDGGRGAVVGGRADLLVVEQRNHAHIRIGIGALRRQQTLPTPPPPDTAIIRLHVSSPGRQQYTNDAVTHICP